MSAAVKLRLLFTASGICWFSGFHKTRIEFTTQVKDMMGVEAEKNL